MYNTSPGHDSREHKDTLVSYCYITQSCFTLFTMLEKILTFTPLTVVYRNAVTKKIQLNSRGVGVFYVQVKNYLKVSKPRSSTVKYKPVYSDEVRRCNVSQLLSVL